MRIPLQQYWALFSTYLRPHWRRVVVLAVLIFSGIGLQLVNPQILRFFVDTAQARGSVHSLVWAAALFMAIVVVQQVIGVASTYVSENLAWTSTNALRHDLAAHCLALDMSFHTQHTPGELIERIDGDVTTLANFFSEFVLQVVGSGLLIVGVLAVLFTVDWRIGAALGVYAVLVLLGLNHLRGISIPYWVAGRQASAEMAGFLEERLAGTEDIRSSRATDFVMRQFYSLMRQILVTYRMAHVMGTASGTFARFSFVVGLAVGLGLGGYLYLHGVISLGTVYMVSYYTGLLSWPLFQITDQLDDLQQATAGLARVNQLRAEPVRAREGTGRPTPPTAPELPVGAATRGRPPRWATGRAGTGTHARAYRADPYDVPEQMVPGPWAPPGPLGVEFDDVAFGYRPEAPVLKGVSFTVAPGEVLGIVGRTGSGKTTISRLLFRLYDLQGGSIRLSGVNIADMRLSDLRQRIGLVTQDVQLFHATVRDNLTFFDRGIEDGRLLGAIETLGLLPWYRSLPDGLDTQLRGSSGLSAGEAQVLALTRVFLKDPEVVVLDEASARLDPATEHLIEHAVAALLRGRTALIIAHRLGTVQRADLILVLADGTVVEYGRREALAADPHSRFAHLLRTGLELELV